MKVDRAKSEPETPPRAKKTGKSTVVLKKGENSDKADSVGSENVNLESKKEPLPQSKADSKVALSADGKEKSKKSNTKSEDGSPAQIAQAEALLGHVNSGKLSESEKDMALKQVGEILAKYRQIQN